MLLALMPLDLYIDFAISKMLTWDSSDSWSIFKISKPSTGADLCKSSSLENKLGKRLLLERENITLHQLLYDVELGGSGIKIIPVAT